LFKGQMDAVVKALGNRGKPSARPATESRGTPRAPAQARALAPAPIPAPASWVPAPAPASTPERGFAPSVRATPPLARLDAEGKIHRVGLKFGPTAGL
jgi:hypothetical protein